MNNLPEKMSPAEVTDFKTEFRDVIDFPNYYISNFGIVFSKRRERAKGGALLPYKMNNGYLRVDLYRNKKRHPRLVHHLVLETFVGPRPSGMDGCHNNGDRLDNRLSNLRWDTRSNNHMDKHKHGTMPLGEKHSCSKITDRDARMIIYLSRTGLFTQREIAQQYNISDTTVHEIIHRKKRTHIWTK